MTDDDQRLSDSDLGLIARFRAGVVEAALADLALLVAVTSLIGTVTYTEVLGIPMPLSLYGLGLLFGVGAIIAKFSPRYWIYFALITPTAALLNAYTTAQAGSVGRQRLVDNVVGAALVLVAALITTLASRLVPSGTAEPAPNA